MFNDSFSIEHLLYTYDIAKKGKLSTGRDRINKTTFAKRHKEIFEIASTKILNATYSPTPYKEVLLLKNKDSKPRCLSIPTIRDNIIIDVLKEELNTSFTCISNMKKMQKVPDVVDYVSQNIKSKRYSGYIKLDISKYYDSIDHTILLEKVKKIIEDDQIIGLIELFLKNPTLPDSDSKDKKKEYNIKGVPQGIAISNILGNIYLYDFDKVLSCDKSMGYVRYVDDIVIFCDLQNIEAINSRVSEIIFAHKLELNEQKGEFGKIETFNFLGYKFLADGSVSIADKNIQRIRLSLEKIFSDYLSSNDKRIKGNINMLKWKINFKITGCFKNGRRYGWVIFFCQNENETIFHELDWLVKKLCYRFKLDNQLIKNDEYVGKRFVKTYNEFIAKKENTEYIPNVDNFSQDKKRDILKTVCKRKSSWVDALNDYLLDREFDRFIFKSIKDIEHDLYQIYT